ncbi:MAG TPA: YdcF family protein [Candidatus Ozemobacteraceae bacterium]|nr:YdcF family protein [Candidatus Ozemobacteraceae bacterium]
MFYVCSKLFQSVFHAGGFVLLLLLVGCALLYTRWERLGRRLVTLLTVFLLCITLFPVGLWSIAPLEEAFSVPAVLPEKVDGIITMGGSNPWLMAQTNAPALNDDAECLTSFIALARRFPMARLVYTGSTGSIVYPHVSEASAAEILMREQGLDATRFTWETEARGTAEKAVNTYRLLQPQAGQTWLLLTSAYRMPRTVAVFEAAGWRGRILPYPVDFNAPAREYLDFNLEESLKWLWRGMKEWIGLVAYRLSGQSDELFPTQARQR